MPVPRHFRSSKRLGHHGGNVGYLRFQLFQASVPGTAASGYIIYLSIYNLSIYIYEYICIRTHADICVDIYVFDGGREASGTADFPIYIYIYIYKATVWDWGLRYEGRDLD